MGTTYFLRDLILAQMDRLEKKNEGVFSHDLDLGKPLKRKLIGKTKL